MKAKKILSLIATGGMCLILSTSVFAESAAHSKKKEISIYDEKFNTAGLVDLNLLPESERTTLQKRTKEIDAYMLKLGTAVSKYKNLIDKTREIESNKAVESNTESASSEQLHQQLNETISELKTIEDEGEKMGLVKLASSKDQKEAKVSTLSSYASDFNMDYLNLRYDTQTGMYLFDGQGQWQNDNWKNDISCAISAGCAAFQTYDAGGYDGFYLASLHKDITIFDKKMYTIKSNGNESIEWTHGSQDAGARGIGWKWQDSVYVTFGLNKIYNSWRQLGWMYFKFTDGVPTGSTVTFKAETSHTWDKTAVNGFSFAPWSIGFQWTTGSDHWEKPGTVNKSF